MKDDVSQVMDADSVNVNSSTQIQSTPDTLPLHTTPSCYYLREKILSFNSNKRKDELSH
jgi:hypothetical protein